MPQSRATLAVVPLVVALTWCLAAHGDEGAKLVAKPSLCIITPSQSACDLRVTVRWHNSRPAYHCLWNELQEDELRCWRDAAEGKVTETRKIGKSLTYWLTGELRELRLAEVEVKVLTAKSSDRRRERRRRHAWSIL